MNTFILKWNPTTSEYKTEQFRNDIQELAEGASIDIPWPVESEHRVRYGDRFFIIREGRGNNGIVMAGYFCSDSFIDDSKDAHTHTYIAEIDPLVLVNIDEAEYVSFDDLRNMVKDVDWDDCPMVTMITEKQAALIENIWLQYMYNNQELFDGYRAGKSWDFDLEDFESVPPTLQTYFKNRYGSDCEKCHRKESEVTEMAYHLVLDDYNPENPAPLNHHLHCLCSECWFGVNEE